MDNSAVGTRRLLQALTSLHGQAKLALHTDEALVANAAFPKRNNRQVRRLARPALSGGRFQRPRRRRRQALPVATAVVGTESVRTRTTKVLRLAKATPAQAHAAAPRAVTIIKTRESGTSNGGSGGGGGSTRGCAGWSVPKPSQRGRRRTAQVIAEPPAKGSDAMATASAGIPRPVPAAHLTSHWQW